MENFRVLRTLQQKVGTVRSCTNICLNITGFFCSVCEKIIPKIFAFASASKVTIPAR